MPSYVAFLRAINLGATRKFPQDDIRTCVESTGATDVATHINTGNVLLTTKLRSRARLEATLEDVFRADRGFEVPTIAYTLAELAGLVADAERLAAGSAERHYVTLLKQEPTEAALEVLDALAYDGERAVVAGRAVHLFLAESAYHSAKLSNAKLEKLLGVATTRDVKVVRALATKWGRG